MPQHSEQSAADFTRFPRRGLLAALAFAAACLALVLPSSALALPGPPIVSGSSFSEATETSVLLEATLNPHEKKTTYAFQYIAQSAWEADGNSFGAGTATAASGEITTGLAEGHQLSTTLSGLAPGTLYRARLFAHNEKGDANEEVLLFATYPTPPPGLPDGRAYEQASPLNKDGGDVGGTVALVKAAAGGEAAIFGSTSGVPGGVGAQELPTYAALRSPGGWLSGGLLPPAELAQRAKVLGWAPDFSRFYQLARLLGSPTTTALYERSAGGAETLVAPYLPGVGYLFAGSSADGSTAVFETSAANLDAGKPGAEGKSNLYAWDGSSLHLASVLPGGAAAPGGAFAGPYDWVERLTNVGGAGSDGGGYYLQNERAVSADGSLFFTTAISGHVYQRRNPTAPEEGCASPAKACTLDVSASHRSPPDPAGHVPAAFQAASADGDTAFLTSPEELTDDANTGPEVEGPKIGRATIGAPPEEEAEEPLSELLSDHHAVGIAVSGQRVYWADPLNHAIGRAKLNGSSTPTEVEDPFIELGGEAGETCAETHPQTEPGEKQCAPSTPRYVAVGPCDGGGECVYWTNTGPLGGDANLKPLEEPAVGAGTIGRARLDGSEALLPESVDADFIAGASNPQGIAVDAEHVYWANSLYTPTASEQDIARAALDGSAVEQQFHELNNGNPYTPYGVALSATRVYWTMENAIVGQPESSVASFPLNPEEGGSQIQTFVGSHLGARGIAVIGPHVYWAAQAQGAEEIGRIDLELKEENLEPEFLKPGGALAGLATDSSESHLYWSANGEVPPHPGNDLYRFQAPGSGGCAEAGGCLADLTPLPGGAGAEVRGVIGASEDGTRLYFVANGVLAGNVVDNGAGPEEAQAGDCGPLGGGFGSGRCNLYEWEAGGGPAGTVSFIAGLDANGDHSRSDDLDWAPMRLPVHEETTARLSPDGRSLLFRSQRRLTAYQNEGTPELYLFRAGEGIACVSCNPTLSPPQGKPGIGRVAPFQFKAEDPASVSSRNLSASGGRAFFETPEPLSAADANGDESCPDVGGPLQTNAYFTCLDVYEWEAPGEGSCTEGGEGYSPANQGCLFLISTGRGAGYPALFADASESGDDVFFFDREGLVGQDEDQLADLYDARVGGGIAAQNPPPPPEPCEGEACKPPPSPSPPQPSPATPGFQGSGNVHEKPKPPCPKGKVRRHGRCVPKHPHHHRHNHHRRVHR